MAGQHAPPGSWPATTPAERARFAANVYRHDDCWIWTGGLEPTGGYGRFRTATRVIAAHRWSYLAASGDLPSVVRHHCDIRCCVKPAHLIGGTQADNNADTRRRGPRRGWGSAPRFWPELAYALRAAARDHDHARVAELLTHPEQLALFR